LETKKACSRNATGGNLHIDPKYKRKKKKKEENFTKGSVVLHNFELRGKGNTPYPDGKGGEGSSVVKKKTLIYCSKRTQGKDKRLNYLQGKKKGGREDLPLEQ